LLELLALLDPIHPLSVGKCGERTAGVRKQRLGKTVYDAILGVVATVITPSTCGHGAWCNFVVVRFGRGCWGEVDHRRCKTKFWSCVRWELVVELLLDSFLSKLAPKQKPNLFVIFQGGEF
jgi:hypothetical protein